MKGKKRDFEVGERDHLYFFDSWMFALFAFGLQRDRSYGLHEDSLMPSRHVNLG